MLQVAFPNIRPPPEVEEVYKGVSAPKRRKVEEESKPVEIPKVGAQFERPCPR